MWSLSKERYCLYDLCAANDESARDHLGEVLLDPFFVVGLQVFQDIARIVTVAAQALFAADLRFATNGPRRKLMDRDQAKRLDDALPAWVRSRDQGKDQRFPVDGRLERNRLGPEALLVTIERHPPPAS